MADCFFCKKNTKEVDFRDVPLMRKFVSGLGKIRSKKKTGLCSTHQRRISTAVKRGRHLGLLSASRK